MVDGLRYGTVFVLVLAPVGALRGALAPALPLMAQTAGALFLMAALVALRQAWRTRKAAE